MQHLLNAIELERDPFQLAPFWWEKDLEPCRVRRIEKQQEGLQGFAAFWPALPCLLSGL